MLWVVPPGRASLVTEIVLGIERVYAEGKMKPHTAQGAHRAMCMLHGGKKARSRAAMLAKSTP